MISETFLKALEYSCRLHSEQIRKGSDTPYVAHLLGVASIIFEYGGTETEAIAGLLHDAIEDQGGDATRQEIHQKFGEEITAIIDGCTDVDTVPKPPWCKRKETYIEHLKTASPSIHLVSAADKLYNARAILADYRMIGEKLWERFKGGKDGTLWYYHALAETFKSINRAPEALIKELDCVVKKIEKTSQTCTS